MTHSTCISKNGGPLVKDVGAVETILVSLMLPCAECRRSGLYSLYQLTLRTI